LDPEDLIIGQPDNLKKDQELKEFQKIVACLKPQYLSPLPQFPHFIPIQNQYQAIVISSYPQ